MKSKSLIKRIFLVLMIIICFSATFVSNVAIVSATEGGWTENADTSIYGKDAEVQDKDTFIDNLIEEKPGFFEKLIIGLIKGITNGLYWFLEKIGISINSVVYGRVGGHTVDGINIFRFELQKGNPYGIVGSAIYATMSGVIIIFIVLTIFGKYSIALYSSGSGHKQSQFKESMGVSILSIALIPLMPYFLDIVLYIADVILSVVSNDGAVKLFNAGAGEGFDIIEVFRDNADNGVLHAFIYLSTILLNLYFAAIYSGYAMSMLVLFISFPMVAAGMNFDKKLLSQWLRQVVSIIVIPILDCVLLMVPAFMGTLPRSASLGLVQLFVCAMVVPARNIFRQLIGLNSTGLELTGVATMIGAAKLAKAAGGAIRNYRSGKKSAEADETMSDYYSDMEHEENVQSRTAGGAGHTIGSVSGSQSSGSSAGMAGGAVSNGNTSYLGKSSGESNPIAEKYANVHNFEENAFKGQLSNQKLAELYKQRAGQRKTKAAMSALGSALGGMTGMGASMFMSPAFSTTMGAAGIKLGGSAGGALGEKLGMSFTRMSPNANEQQQDANEQQQVALFPAQENGAEFFMEPYVGEEREQTGIEPDFTIENAHDFCYANGHIATDIVNCINKECSFNDGQKLQEYYNQFRDNYRALYDKDQIKLDFKAETRKILVNEFEKRLMNDKRVRYCGDEKINNMGMKSMAQIYENTLDKHIVNSEGEHYYGILSDEFLNSFSWWQDDPMLTFSRN